MKNRRSPLSRNFSMFFLVLWAIIMATGLSHAGPTWDLGPRSFSITERSALPLSVRSSGRGSLGKFSFVGAVGGVNFETEAEPDDALRDKPIILGYDPKQQDGRRLRVTIGKDSYKPFLPDWQLKPIVDFVDTSDTAVVSLFGDGPDREKYYYIQYHKAFKDTLLGMRLLQADILFIDLANHWQLPKWDGQVVLGESESPTDSEAGHNAMNRLQKIFQNHNWQSWVLTDIDTIPQFTVSNGELVISASPYYYFWITLSERTDNISQYKNTADRYQRMVNKYNAKVDRLKMGLDEYSSSVISQLQTLKSEIESIEKSLLGLQHEIENPKVHEVIELTSAMKGQSETLRNYNPAVYNAYVKTAGYAAFFRYVKKNYLQTWRKFRNKIYKIDIDPDVITPTAWERK